MKVLFECHDCETELTIIDNTQQLEIEQITVCPVCGSNNIITKQK